MFGNVWWEHAEQSITKETIPLFLWCVFARSFFPDGSSAKLIILVRLSFMTHHALFSGQTAECVELSCPAATLFAGKPDHVRWEWSKEVKLRKTTLLPGCKFFEKSENRRKQQEAKLQLSVVRHMLHWSPSTSLSSFHSLFTLSCFLFGISEHLSVEFAI